MKYTVSALIIVIIFILIAVTLKMPPSPQGEEPARETKRETTDEAGGFREWVKNPEYKDAVARSWAEREEARKSLHVPEDISDTEIRKMVDRLFVQEDKDFNYDRLKLVGKRAKPFLVDALADRRVATRFDPDGFTNGPNYPLQRLCGLLEEIDPSVVVEPLTPYAEHEDDHLRQYASSVLGRIGSSECVGPLLKALDDEDDYVRSDAMRGIQSGIKSGSCTKVFLDAVFPGLVKLLDRRDQSVGGKAPVLLLAINTDRAIPILLSEKYFTITNRELHHIIEALNEAGHKIPHDKLQPLLKELKPRSEKYPHSYDYAEALKAYALNPDSEAEQTFRAELSATNERVQEAAAESLGILTGITNASGVVFAALDQRGFQRLTKPQKFYYAVVIYDAEVRNGGHSQYFVNSSGDLWKTALAGMKSIGANERATILQKAVDLFGADGASENNDTRHARLAEFSEKQDESLDQLDTDYYACKENIEALLALYAIDNKEHFVADE